MLQFQYVTEFGNEIVTMTLKTIIIIILNTTCTSALLAVQIYIQIWNTLSYWQKANHVTNKGKLFVISILQLINSSIKSHLRESLKNTSILHFIPRQYRVSQLKINFNNYNFSVLLKNQLQVNTSNHSTRQYVNMLIGANDTTNLPMPTENLRYICYNFIQKSSIIN